MKITVVYFAKYYNNHNEGGFSRAFGSRPRAKAVAEHNNSNFLEEVEIGDNSTLVSGWLAS